MLFDICVIAVLAVSMVLGFRSGFIYACIHTVGWLLAVLMGFIWTPRVCDFLAEKTGLDTSLYNAFYSRFSESFSVADDTLAQLPAILTKVVDSTETAFVSSVSETIAGLCFYTLGFLLVVLTVKIVLWFFTEMLSKKRNDGFTGILDGMLGLSAGLIRGFLIVFFLLALFVPFSGFLEPDTAAHLCASLRASHFAKDLYDNNLLMLIVRSFLA